jgi:hypothetical protein
MGFVAISLDEYVKSHVKSNASEDAQSFRQRLEAALRDHQNGITCACGNDIWVIGSAVAWNGCFTCITGEACPDDDYEIDAALPKKHMDKGQGHIGRSHRRFGGIFNDDGTKVDRTLIKKPSLCIICALNNDPNEEILCDMTRHDQRNSDDFQCFAFRKI